MAGLLLSLRGQERFAKVLHILPQNSVLCLQTLRLLGRRRLGGGFKPLWLNLSLPGLLDLLRFKLVYSLLKLLILVVQQVEVLLNGLVFLREDSDVVFQVLNVLICLCLAQLCQNVALELLPAARVLVEHRGA